MEKRGRPVPCTSQARPLSASEPGCASAWWSGRRSAGRWDHQAGGAWPSTGSSRQPVLAEQNWSCQQIPLQHAGLSTATFFTASAWQMMATVKLRFDPPQPSDYRHRPGGGGQRPKSLARNPPPVAVGSEACPAQRSARGTPLITDSTCWPHPAHVVFPHCRQFTARHTFAPSLGGSSSAHYIPHRVYLAAPRMVNECEVDRDWDALCPAAIPSREPGAPVCEPLAAQTTKPIPMALSSIGQKRRKDGPGWFGGRSGQHEVPDRGNEGGVNNRW